MLNPSPAVPPTSPRPPARPTRAYTILFWFLVLGQVLATFTALMAVGTLLATARPVVRWSFPLPTPIISTLPGGDSIILPLSANPEGIPQGTPSGVTFTAMIANYLVAPPSLSLRRVDGVSNHVVGQMHDDGLNGDLQDQDGVYTGGISLNEPNEGSIQFEASTFFSGVPDERFSAPFTLWVTCHPTRVLPPDMGKVVTDLATGHTFPSNDVLVTFQETTCARRNEIAALIGGTIAGTSPGTGIHQIRFPGTSAADVNGAIDTLLLVPEVLSAKPHLLGARASVVPQ